MAPAADTASPIAAETNALLFCGQGAQTVGMTAEQLAIPEVARMFEVATDLLGYDLKQIVLHGPPEALNQTEHAQPALLIAGLAAVHKLQADDPGALSRVTAVAGLSLGEYTALVHAGALTFEDAIKVVGVRARAMQSAGKEAPGKMATVINLDDATLDAIVAEVSAQTGDVIAVSNLLFPKGRVLGGTPAALSAAVSAVKARGRVIVKELQVSGAFHTELMAKAQKPLADALAEVDISIPKIPVIANTTGKPYTSIDEIRTELVKQIVAPVLWEQSVEAILARHATTLYDMGPRQSIVPMIRKIDRAAAKKTKSVDV